MKNNKKRVILGVTIFLMLLFLVVGTYAYWTWRSPNKNIVFNSAKDLAEYIVYDEGESKFVGDLQVGDNYLDGVHTTISIYKKDADDLNLFATINMDINEIGNVMRQSAALKWTITSGSSDSNGVVLGEGYFIDFNQGTTIELLSNIEVTSEEQEFTVWLWIDEAENPPVELTGEKLDTIIWTQVDLIDKFTFSKIKASYNLIQASVVNADNNISAYQITKTEEEPTEWVTLSESETGKSYNLNYIAEEVGTYYVWFRDTEDNVIKKSVTVDAINTSKPVCTWGEFTPNLINSGETSTITLTCTGVNYQDTVLNISDIEVVGDNVSVTDIVKMSINNGNRYTITILSEVEFGITNLVLPAGKIKNILGEENNRVESTKLITSKVFPITYKDVGNTAFSGVHEENYPTEYPSGTEVVLDIPTREGYIFGGYYLESDGSGELITKTIITQNGSLTIYAKWIEPSANGTASLSLNNAVYTLSLSDYSDNLTGTFGYALINSGSCEDATYENSTELSKTYSENLENNITYYGCIKLTSNSGKITYVKTVGVEFLNASGTMTYTSVGEHEFIAPGTGTYKLEVWGASGGSGNYSTPGYGGYSIGNVQLTAGEPLYINVGGIGNAGSGSTGGAGGHNGGGKGGNGYASWGKAAGAGGGGATHIAKVSGTLSTLENYKGELYSDNSTYNSSYILIVAGGGGGGTHWESGSSYSGGSGGGNSGVVGKLYSGTVSGGTQTSGASFGAGANGVTKTALSCGAEGSGGGGGGWYGGNTASKGENTDGGGGGGSGYIGSSLLTNKYMYCYGCSESTSTNIYTVNTKGSSSLRDTVNCSSGYSSNAVSKCAKSGNGAAKITYDLANEVDSLILTYDNNGGSGCTSKQIINGEEYGELCIPLRDGYKFAGWYTASTAGTQIVSSTEVTVTENQTIYAHWTATTNPVITINPNGNGEYVTGNISSIITVTKGSNQLDGSTFKYIYSKDINAEPTESFISGLSYSLENATGIYYLIVRACDVEGNCVTEKSNPFYVDNEGPTGDLSITIQNNSIIALVNATDNASGILNYGYLMQDNPNCPTSGYTTIENNNYTFTSNTSNNYVCVKITDNMENITYLVSEKIEPEIIASVAIEQKIQVEAKYFSNSVSSYCVNESSVDTNDCEWISQTSSSFTTSASYVEDKTYYVHIKDGAEDIYHSNPVVMYHIFTEGSFTFVADNSSVTKPYEYVQEDEDNWKIRFLTTGTVTFDVDTDIEVFLVGGGGGAGRGASSWCMGNGGGGGYNTLAEFSPVGGENYKITIGAGGSAATGTPGIGGNGGTSSAFGFEAAGGYGGGWEGNGTGQAGGDGGSGGGGRGGSGGSNGSSGTGSYAGTGSGVNSYEFRETSCGILYAGGGAGRGCTNCGGAGGGGNVGQAGGTNTGGGGGGTNTYAATGGAGGSGIVVIRNSRKTIRSLYAGSTLLGRASGKTKATVESDGNWNVQFLVGGVFIPNQDMTVDIFMVGGGGGGANGTNGESTNSGAGGGGGGGGYRTTQNSYTLTAGQTYEIVVGVGGEIGKPGEPTTIKLDGVNLLTANGGAAGGGGAANSTTGGGIGGAGGSAGGNGGIYTYITASKTYDATAGSNGAYAFGDTAYAIYGGGGGGGGGGAHPYYYDSSGTIQYRDWGKTAGGAGGSGGGGYGGNYSSYTYATSGKNYTGGGGGGGSGRYTTAGLGGSGIVIIRNAR